MDIGLALRALYALAVVGVLLFALWYAAKASGRGRVVAAGAAGGPGRRLIAVLETVHLSQQSTLHVVKAGARYLVVGGGASGVRLVSELDEEDVRAWLDEQRRAHEAQAETIAGLLRRFRGS